MRSILISTFFILSLHSCDNDTKQNETASQTKSDELFSDSGAFVSNQVRDTFSNATEVPVNSEGINCSSTVLIVDTTSQRLVTFKKGIWRVNKNAEIKLLNFDYDKYDTYGAFYIDPKELFIAFKPLAPLELSSGSNLWIYGIAQNEYSQVTFLGKEATNRFASIITNFVGWLPNSRGIVYEVFSNTEVGDCDDCSTEPDPSVNYGFYYYDITSSKTVKIHEGITQIICALSDESLLVLMGMKYYVYNINSDSLYTNSLSEYLEINFSYYSSYGTNADLNYFLRGKTECNSDGTACYYVFERINLKHGDICRLNVSLTNSASNAGYPMPYTQISPKGNHISWISSIPGASSDLIINNQKIIDIHEAWKNEIDFGYDWINEAVLILYSDSRIELYDWTLNRSIKSYPMKLWKNDFYNNPKQLTD